MGEARINSAVFPGLQGAPHNHTISALAVALKMAQTPEFKAYQEQALKNAAALGESLAAGGFNFVSGGTDNHALLVDLRPKGVNGRNAALVCEAASIILNKSTVPGDKSAMRPSGVRVGTLAMTSRGLVEQDFLQIGIFISEALAVTAEIQETSGTKLSDFKRVLDQNPPNSLKQLKSRVEAFALRFEGIGPIQDATQSLAPLSATAPTWDREERLFGVVPSLLFAAGGLAAAMGLQATSSAVAAEPAPDVE